MIIDDFDENALQELKRADQSIYVTLKYTRTADVIRGVIQRLINAYDFSILSALKLLEIKPDPIKRMRIEQLGKYLKDAKQDIKFYTLMRRIVQADFTGREEYRKNVTLVTKFEEVNIVMLIEYFERTKRFVVMVEDFISKQKLKLERSAKRKAKKKKIKRKSKKKKKQ